MTVFTPEIECAKREELEKIQTARLKTAVKRAYENIPFYKKKFDEAGINPDSVNSIHDITKLPFTEKQDLRDNYPFGLFAVPMRDVIRIHASSGTTGKPTVVGYTKYDIDIWAESTARAIAAAGGTRDDIIHISYGYGLFTGGLGLHYGAERLGAVALPVSSGNTARQVQLLRDFGSNIICCTPSYAMYIGETMKEMGIDPYSLPLRAGIFGAEPWTEGMRAEIENLLGIKAYDIYGLSEITGPGVSYDCCCQKHLHVNEDYFYPEVVDVETGKPLPDGEYGELVFTCIGKEALPLIRYRTHDISALFHEQCECGRTTVRMAKPRGRSDDMLIIRGVNVFPSQVEYTLTQLGCGANYLIIVDRKNNLDIMEVKVEINENMASDTVRDIERAEKRIEAALQSALNVSAKVTLVEPKTLPRSEGKAKRVIDNRKF
ncbi:MAG: phenylacetate--CoA ligase [Clostridiales bacterium]|jgi:phenylacetate-CoA ligase|nr:phenylacetate--CoA ligase [Clostridiales bacterium]